MLKQSIERSANFRQNAPVVARSGYVRRLVQEAFVEDEVDASLFAGPQRAGLTRGETALLQLLKRQADTPHACPIKAQGVCVTYITACGQQWQHSQLIDGVEPRAGFFYYSDSCVGVV